LAADTKEVSAVAHSSVERRDGICGEVEQRVEAGRGAAARGGRRARAPLAVPEEGRKRRRGDKRLRGGGRDESGGGEQRCCAEEEQLRTFREVYLKECET